MPQYIAKVEFELFVKFKKEPSNPTNVVKSHLQIDNEDDNDIHNLSVTKIPGRYDTYKISFDTKGLSENQARFESEFMAELDEDSNYSEIDNYKFLEKSFTYKLYSPTPVKKTVKAARCPKGTRKNPKTGNCEKSGAKKASPKKASSKKASPKKRCPNGTRKNPKTGNCEKK